MAREPVSAEEAMPCLGILIVHFQIESDGAVAAARSQSCNRRALNEKDERLAFGQRAVDAQRERPPDRGFRLDDGDDSLGLRGKREQQRQENTECSLPHEWHCIERISHEGGLPSCPRHAGRRGASSTRLLGSYGQRCEGPWSYSDAERVTARIDRDVCIARIAALNEARRRSGATAFDRFLYEVVAPQTRQSDGRTPRPPCRASARLRRVGGRGRPPLHF